MKKLILIVCLFLGLGCKKPDSCYLDISPKGIEISANPGQNIYFQLQGSSGVKLSRLSILRTGNVQDTLLLDTAINVKSFSLNWMFKTPTTSTNNINLVFTLSDEDGNVFKDQRVIILNTSSALVENINNVMYSKANALLNSFNLSSLNPITYDSLLFDSLPQLLPDLRELNNNPLASQFDVSGLFYSPSGGKFVKANSVNYSIATQSDLQSLFNGNFNETAITDSLKVGDIYAFKSNASAANQVLCFIKIDQIIFGSSPGKYVFSIKK